MTGLVNIPAENQNYKVVLSKRYGGSEQSPEDGINGVRWCDVPVMRLCITR